jgi:DNA repair exonuclease SbcCD nuclease subunit
VTVRKILHAADIHLDSPLQRLGTYENAPQERIRGASRRALENMVQLAISQSVDLVVIAGDLYDGDWPDQNTGLFFVAQASELVRAGIPLVVIRGNHDAANVMTSSLPLPTNPDGSTIMMRSDTVDLRQFDSIGVAVHGRSFRSRAETENMALQYPAPISGMFNLGLLHTSLTGAEGHDPYAPCTPNQLADKNYDYWALGHVHARGEYGVDGAAPVVFSGNIQGRHIRETGEKGCVIIEVDSRGQCQPSFHPLDVVRWNLCRIDTSQMTHFDEVMDAYQHELLRRIGAVGDRLLVLRVELCGATALHAELHRRHENLNASLRATTVSHGGDRAWLEGVRLRTAGLDSDTRIADLEGPLESLTQVVTQLQSDDDAASVVQQELKSLLKKLPQELTDGGEAIPLHDPQWLAELIESASADVLARLRLEESAK